MDSSGSVSQQSEWGHAAFQGGRKLNSGAITAVTTAVNATIIAVVQEQRRKTLAHFSDQQAYSTQTAVDRASLDADLQSTHDQLCAQGILKDGGDARSYLDVEALLAYEKKVAKGSRIALVALIPVLVAVVVAIVVAMVSSR